MEQRSWNVRTQQTVLAWPSGRVGDTVKHRHKATWPVFTMTWIMFCCCQPGVASSNSCLSSASAVFSIELILWPSATSTPHSLLGRGHGEPHPFIHQILPEHHLYLVLALVLGKQRGAKEASFLHLGAESLVGSTNKSYI